jgi:hypothetical protein
MVNIKISELNELTQKENNDFLPIVDSSANETKKISVGNLTPSNDKLVHVGTSVDEDYRVNVLHSKNLIGLGTQLNGYVDASNNIFYTENSSIGYYFETSKLPNTITFDGTNGNRANVCYFNTRPANGVTCQLRSASNDLPRTINVDKSYTYIHIQFSYSSAVTNIMVNGGSEALPYEPYIVPSINVDNEEIYSKPAVLFNQKAASATTSLPLSDAYTNYRYLEIYGRTTNNGTFYKKVDTSNTIFTIDISTPITGSLTIQEYVNLYSMSDNTITCTRYLRNNYANGSANVVSETNGIFIDKVIGYK